LHFEWSTFKKPLKDWKKQNNMKTRTYKNYFFKYLYRQWVNDELGGFAMWKEVIAYLDNKRIIQRKLSTLTSY